jgi:hypothetical protein
MFTCHLTTLTVTIIRQDYIKRKRIILRGREEEICGINGHMRQVNNSYKSLAHVVGSQQEQIEHVEMQMEESKENAKKELCMLSK